MRRTCYSPLPSFLTDGIDIVVTEVVFRRARRGHVQILTQDNVTCIDVELGYDRNGCHCKSRAICARTDYAGRNTCGTEEPSQEFASPSQVDLVDKLCLFLVERIGNKPLEVRITFEDGPGYKARPALIGTTAMRMLREAAKSRRINLQSDA